ncbi:MAG: CD225/dispanin family protein [Muribaculaceae bacterium]|nr:CD225/dispanin family protein [Muribaculaceae bacterium]
MADKYYAMLDGERKGPFSLEELPGAGVRPSTYIWCKGMPDWQKAEENADVCRLFRNHLYDIMHPGANGDNLPQSVEDDRWKVAKDTPHEGPYPSRFDHYLQQTGNDPLPTLEDIDARKDKSVPPVSMIGYAWLVTFFCCIPTGIVALVYAYKSRRAWNEGKNTESHEYCRSAKMWTGISLFLGLIGYGLFLALSM